MMFRWEYGVDLGTSRISIACPEKKLFCRQANLLAMDGRSGRVCAMGDEALAMLGRTPPWIEVYQPVEKGLVSRPELAGDLHTQGSVLTGGGARLRGLPDYLAGALRVPVRLAEHASGCAARGAARGAALEKRLENGVLVF